MEQTTTATSVPCVFTTQDPGSQVVVTQLPQDQLQVVSSYQALRPVQGAGLLEARVQDGIGTIPAVQAAMYQTESSSNVSGQSLQAQAQFQAQLPTSYFSTTSIEGLVESNSSTSVSPSTYDEVVKKLSQLFTSELTQIHNITDDHWKVQEFPLARIKKIMRMDEDVRMISAEVPVMLSKALELFITELSLRAWLQTEESKRRTVQRSDIAMAITKNDMFDFLIDIVPREEIQLRSKTQKSTEGGGGGESLQLLPPELLQLCIQQLAQQALSTSAEGGLGEEESGISGNDSNDSSGTVGLLQQQLQLLQQLMQIQQLQQEQQLDQTSSGLGQTIQLQHPPILDQPQATNTPTQQSTSVVAPTLDTEVLYSSVSGISTAGNAGGGAAGAIQFSTALEQLTGAGNQTILSIQPEQHSITQTSSVGATSFTDGGQQTLHHVDPNSIAFHHQPHELLQQPGSHSATVIIQSPMMDDVTTSNQAGTTVTTLLDSQGQFSHHHHQLQQHVQSQQTQLVTSDSRQAAATLQHQMVHHVLVDPATLDQTAGNGHFQLSAGSGGSSQTGAGNTGSGGVVSSVLQSGDHGQQSNLYGGQTVAVSMAEGMEFGNDGSLTLHDGLPSTTVTYSS